MSYATENILGSYEKAVSAATSGTSRTASDKDMFLKLLVAQLSHQDPLNPVEDKEFVAQLAQFTSVEELQNINKGIESMNTSFNKQQIVNAAAFLGTQVSAKGDTITRADDYVSTMYVTYPQNVASGTVKVYSTTADGQPDKLVYSANLSPTQAGTQQYVWSGLDNNGKTMANGTYIVTFSALNSAGENMLVSTESDGVVVAVEAAEGGNHYLYLNDGRKVRYTDVQVIAYPQKSDGSTDGKTDGETKDGTTTTGETTT